MLKQMVEVRFGGEQVEFLTLSVRGRSYRQSRDTWDGNWLLVTATIHAGKFSGEIPGMLRAEELEHFRQQLQDLHQSLQGSVIFQTTEDWLYFTIEADNLGHINLYGNIRDDVGSANHLTFRLAADQTFLPTALKQLQAVTELFPVVGKP